jgi:hypothetical protein
LERIIRNRAFVADWEGVGNDGNASVSKITYVEYSSVGLPLHWQEDMMASRESSGDEETFRLARGSGKQAKVDMAKKMSKIFPYCAIHRPRSPSSVQQMVSLRCRVGRPNTGKGQRSRHSDRDSEQPTLSRKGPCIGLVQYAQA